MKFSLKKCKYLITALVIIFLSACSSIPKTTLVPTQVSSIEQAQSWELKGKLLVRTPKDKFSTNLFWLHEPQRDQLTLTTMLGTTVLSLDAQPNKVMLTADGKTYKGNDAQALLQRLTGWSIPIELFPYWITGQVRQDDLIQTRDAKGNPKQAVVHLNHIQWVLDYRSWQQQSGVNVPRLLQVNQPNLNLKIQINEWQALAPK